MTDIVAFLNARQDEDEAAAVRAARPETWVKPLPPRPDWYVQFWADEQDRAAVIADPESSAYPVVATLGYDGNDEATEELAEGRVEHIARHDPARVLREVKAKRAIVAEHMISSHPERWGDVRHHPEQNYPSANYVGQLTGETVYSCATCDHDPEDGDGPTKRALPGCETLLALAAIYDDHPDYDPAWSAQ